MSRRPERVLQSAEFKANALAEMRRVRDTGQPITVTSHGRPMVRIMPLHDIGEPTGYRCMLDTYELLASESAAFPPRKT